MEREQIDILEMYYAQKVSNQLAAAHLGVGIRQYTAMRHNAEYILIGILSVINAQKYSKSA
jgi:hypothetical protein